MKISFIFIMLALCATLNSQVRQPHSLYFMETIPQISQMNPALQPRANFYVMLPSVNVDLLSDLAVKDIFQQQGNKWHTPVESQYDYAKLRRSIGKKSTMLNGAADVDLLGFGFRMGNNYFSFGISEHIAVNTALPSDLFKIPEKFFPNGTALDFSPLRTQGIAYMQLRFGFSYQVTDKLTVGVNLKPIFGQFAVATKVDKFMLRSGEQQWELDGKGNIYSSAPIDIIMKEDDKDKIDEIEFRDFDDYEVNDWVNSYATGFNNPGIAFDLGATYQYNERLTLSASLNNLGFIAWNKDLNSIAFNGKYTFEGLYYDISDDNDDPFGTLIDSIANAMNYNVRHDKFKTPLAPVLHVAASYRLTPAVSVGLMSRTVFWNKGVRQSFNTTLSLQPYSFVSMNVGATWQVKSNVFFGGGFTFLLGPLPLQFYLLVDNAPVYYSTLKINDNEPIPYIPERLKTLTMRTGLNLIFGRHGYVNKPMLNKGNSSWN